MSKNWQSQRNKTLMRPLKAVNTKTKITPKWRKKNERRNTKSC